MSSAALEYCGMQFDQRSNENRPAFKKKDGGTWMLAPGPVNWSQYQAGQKLFVTWDNWTAQSVSTEIPQKKSFGGGRGPQVYHPETFVSNVVGQAIQAGLIKQPSDLSAWANQAWSIIKGLQGQSAQPTSAPAGGPAPAPHPAESPDFDDKIPFMRIQHPYHY